MAERFTNNASTTLNGAINNAVTSLVVTSASLFPTAGNFRIRIEDEIMLVTAVAGTTFTVTRAYEGTAAASHANAVTVREILTAGVMTLADVWDEILTKVSDTGRTGTTSTDDPELISAVTYGSGELVEILLQLVWSSTSTTPDIKFHINSNQTMQGWLNVFGSDTTANAVLSSATKISGTTSANQTAGTNNGVTIVTVMGVMRFGAGSASLSLQWATNSGGGTTVTLEAGSKMYIRRLGVT